MRVGSPNPPQPSSPAFLRLLPILFFLSGASSLIFETIFRRLLTYTFGNTAHVVSTVLAAFGGGLALEAYALGRWVDRRRAPPWKSIASPQMRRARGADRNQPKQAA
jgi:predicted MFS family arabinose efflux permease